MEKFRLVVVFSVLMLFPITAYAQQCTQSQLNTEFTTDLTARGYNTCAGFPNGDDQCVLTRFNAPCADAACKIDQVVTREQIYAAIDHTELNNMASGTTTGIGTSADDKRLRLLGIAMNNVTFDLSVGNVRQLLFDIFPSANYPTTNAAITALRQKNAPRSQIVCGRAANLCDVSLGLRGVGC